MKVHIGEEIERKFQESGLKMGVFAERINTGERNVYSIFKRADISAEMLRAISEVLNFNFFSFYQEALPDSLLQEPSQDYNSSTKTFTFSISLTARADHMSKFPDLITKMSSIAQDMGFKID